MGIDISKIVLGGIYRTKNNQERKVWKITDRVYYYSRSGNVKNEWTPGHTLERPPSLEKFACDVEEKIGEEDINDTI